MTAAHGTIFTAQEQRPPTGGVGQDKGAFECERTKLIQPASVKDVINAHQTTEHQSNPNTNHHLSKKQHYKKRYRKQRTIWLEPQVDTALQRAAEQAGLSFSMTAANQLKFAVQQDVVIQQTALMEPIVEKAIRTQANRQTEFLVLCYMGISQLLRLVYNGLARLPDNRQMSEENLNRIMDESANAAHKEVRQRLVHLRTLFEKELQELFGEEGTR